MIGHAVDDPSLWHGHCHNAGQVTHSPTPVDLTSSTRVAARLAADTDRTTYETTPPMTADDSYWEPFPDTLSTADLSKILNVGRPAVLTRLQAGIIPGHLIVGSWVIFKAEVRAWLEANSNQATTTPPAEVDVLADYGDELGYRELMAIMGKSKGTIYTWLKTGAIPAFHVGNRWIIHKPQLRAKLHQTSNQTAPEES